MADATTTQKRTIQALSLKLFQSRSGAVEIAGPALQLHHGLTDAKARALIVALRKVDELDPTDPARALIVALRKVDELDPTDPAVALVEQLTGVATNPSSIAKYREEHMTSTAAPRAKANGRALGPVEGKPWQQWATEQLGLERDNAERECPKCHGTGRVVKVAGRKQFPAKAVAIAVNGYATAPLGKTLADPPLSRVRHVAGLLDCNLDEASVWIEQLRQAILAESAAASS